MEEQTIKTLFPQDGKLTFLVGAGCSTDAPSNLPMGRQMMRAIIQHCCAVSEIETLLNVETLRFEHLVEILRDRLDPELKVIDYYGLCDKPNTQHFFLAGMMKQGHYVMTTNFDHLIEDALLLSGIARDNIIPVITKADFELYSDPEKLMKEGKYPIYKIHGSPTNSITGENTKTSLIATMQAFGAGKEGESVFQLEPHKRPLFEQITKSRRLVVIGYSGSDDFDIVPTLRLLPHITHILWIDHAMDSLSCQIMPVSNDFQQSPHDKVGRILNEIHRMGYQSQIYRIHGYTLNVLSSILPLEEKGAEISWNQTVNEFFAQSLPPSDEFDQYYIPYKIYDDLTLVEQAERCIRKGLLIAREWGDKAREGVALDGLGLLLKGKGELDQALNIFQAALGIYEQLEDHRGKAIILNNIGLIFGAKGDLDHALINYQDALTILEQLGDNYRKAIIFINIGLILGSKGDLDQALTNHHAARAIAEQLGDLSLRVTALINIGFIYRNKGDLDQALTNYQAALAIDEQLGDLHLEATTLNNIGLVFKKKGDLDQALTNYQAALAIDEQLGDLHGKAGRLTNIGSLLFEKGDVEQALTHLHIALDIMQNIGAGNSRQAQVIRNNITIIQENKSPQKT